MTDCRVTLISVSVAMLATSCVQSDLTRIGPTYPAKAEGCQVDVFPSTQPPYPYQDVAMSRASCSDFSGRSACIERLKADTCAVGGDAAYGFKESYLPGNGGTSMISATLARKTGETKKEAPASAAPALSAAQAQECTPPCSPGFACRANICEPQCNPACGAGEICTSKRLCEPKAADK